MDKRLKGIIAGAILGFIVTLIGTELYLLIFTNYELFTDFSFIRNTGMLGRVIAIGSLMNLILFTYFINQKRDFLARGCILAVILLTLLTLVL